MHSLGLDIGYSSSKIVLIDDKNKVVYDKYLLHKGNIKESLKTIFEEIDRVGKLSSIEYGAVTGNGSKMFACNQSVNRINEITAMVEGVSFLSDDAKSIIEIGGQNTRFVSNFEQSDKSFIQVSTNSNCAAGTGSFIEQQMLRLNLPLEKFSDIAQKADTVPRIAGRCSVFAKTDIIHHQQEGVPIGDILLGLAYSVVRNYKGGVVKRQAVRKPVCLIGGVIANNSIVSAIKDVFKLEDKDLIINEYYHSASAIGAAILAKNVESKINIEKILSVINQDNSEYLKQNENCYPPLEKFGNNDSLNKHIIHTGKAINPIYFVGVDIGSTSTNIVLTDEQKNIVSYRYIRTLGDPIDSVRKGFDDIKKELGNDIKVSGIGVTGSGRYMIGKMLKADVIKDEITSQATAAITLDKDVDTIFEIGGQDSKFISIKNGSVHDFQMNKVCAAGTGSFIEEQSEKFKIPINEFSTHALRSEQPAELGERCTVFIESSIANRISEGRNLDDISAGLCYSIVKNYLNRVAIKNKIGNKIFLQGGIAHNQGVINAFRSVTGKEIMVPPFFSVTGAYGVAVLTQQQMKEHKNIPGKLDFEFDKNFEPGKDNKIIENTFQKKMDSSFFSEYIQPDSKLKKSVGIPRTLFAYSMFSMLNKFFENLGFNVVLSDITNDEIIQISHKYSVEQVCYPIKLLFGHIEDLIQKGVDFIYFPNLFNANDGYSKSRKNYSCVYLQAAPKMIESVMNLQDKNITLLSPTLASNLGKAFIAENYIAMGKQLGKTRDEVLQSLTSATQKVGNQQKAMKLKKMAILNKIDSNEKCFVIISKIYGVADPVLNMGVPDRLIKMGYNVISFSDLMENDIFEEYPNMYWPFAQYELGAAKYIKDNPNLYAVLLTHHGCGPDSIINHYFKEIMKEKSYLHIEVDEHTSDVGVITRVEAFLNSVQNSNDKIGNTNFTAVEKYVRGKMESRFFCTPADTIYIHDIHPYSGFFRGFYNGVDCNIELLPQTSRKIINTGRKHIMTNEYFSLTALLGNVFEKAEEVGKSDANVAFFIPQNEGAEIDGQYSQLIRTKLDEEGFSNIKIISPFIEDLIFQDQNKFQALSLLLLAGDVINNAFADKRSYYLQEVLGLIKNKRLDIKSLKSVARKIFLDIKINPYKNKILATGEPVIIFNENLNNNLFNKIETKDNRVLYSPLSEYLLFLLSDFASNNQIYRNSIAYTNLSILMFYIEEISEQLEDESPFATNFDLLRDLADNFLKFYTGANGRYRFAKSLSQLEDCKGIVSVSSMYENTGVIQNIVIKNSRLPVLHLNFDGNKNSGEESKIDSFLYYL